MKEILCSGARQKQTQQVPFFLLVKKRQSIGVFRIDDSGSNHQIHRTPFLGLPTRQL
jgi:hypothetical protein